MNESCSFAEGNYQQTVNVAGFAVASAFKYHGQHISVEEMYKSGFCFSRIKTELPLSLVQVQDSRGMHRLA